jgi:hypothetical protein
MSLATLVDAEALLNVALYGLAGSTGLVIAYGLAVLAHDRASRDDRHGAAATLAWRTVFIVGAGVCLAILAVGFWAMTQKS